MFKKPENKCWQKHGEIRTFIHCWECKMVLPLWECLINPQKVKHTITI